MKIIPSFPKKVFNKFKNSSLSRSFSRSDRHPSSSFNSTATESSSSSSPTSKKTVNKNGGVATPTSVLPSSPDDDWSDISANVFFEIQEAFKLIDSDGDGKITRDELAAFLSRVGKDPPSSEEMDVLLSEIDRNGDGCIGIEEFGAISCAFGPPACDSELKEAFDFFDTDHDGQITAEELFNVFRELGDSRCTLADCRSMINGVDKNGDGFVCFADFCRMMDLHR